MCCWNLFTRYLPYNNLANTWIILEIVLNKPRSEYYWSGRFRSNFQWNLIFFFFNRFYGTKNCSKSTDLDFCASIKWIICVEKLNSFINIRYTITPNAGLRHHKEPKYAIQRDFSIKIYSYYGWYSSSDKIPQIHTIMNKNHSHHWIKQISNNVCSCW